MDATDTPTRVLDAAQALIQERGYNAFSYKDLAAAVGIRTASIHYHFPTKADLARALMDRLIDQWRDLLASIDAAAPSSRERLKAFMALYRDIEGGGALCLCGSLATDLVTLPDTLRAVVSEYLVDSESWLVRTLDEGARAGEFTLHATAQDLAVTLLASLQGGLILARGHGGRPLVDSLQRAFLQSLAGA